MKICFKFIVLCIIELQFVFLRIALSSMGRVALSIFLEESFCMVHSFANARCIHDELKFAIKDQSPQKYSGIAISDDEDHVIKVEVSSHPSVHAQIVNEYLQTQRDFTTNSRTFQSQSVTQAENSIHELQKLQSSLKEQSSISSNLSKLFQEAALSSVIESRSERIRRDSGASRNEIEYLNEISLEEVSQNISSSFSSVMYHPIRLKIWYDFPYISFGNSSIEFERFKQGLDRATEQIKKLFSVLPIEGSLFLKRVAACGSYWQSDASTLNTRKCGRISQEYRGERCLDDFKVPDSHLSGFATYDKNGSEPDHIHYPDGEGIADTDTVIYVRSHHTTRCAEGNIIAYATTCQLDQYYRPIAGYANFCPHHFSSIHFNADKFYLVDPLVTDDLTLVCEEQNGVVDYVDGWHRVLSPSVVREATTHFNCSYIGGPLEGAADTLMESSHWESRYLRSSLMTASIGMPHLTVLDRITLALFNDSGWYKVNMSQASQLIWGKNEGCDFGTLDYCHAGTHSFFCSGDNTHQGCHFMHLDKGVCESGEFLDSCRVYQAETGGGCWDSTTQRDSPSWKGEVFSTRSRCFISNITSNGEVQQGLRTKRDIFDREGRCYEMRCNDTETLEIRVRGADWVHCVSNERTQIPGYDGYIMCPKATIVCDKSLNWRANTKSGSAECVRITLFFVGLEKFFSSFPTDTERAAKVNIFMTELVEVVNQLIAENDTSLGHPPSTKQDSVSFTLKSLLSNSNSCPHAVRRVKSAVASQSLMVSMGEKKFVAAKILSTYTLQPCGSPFHPDPDEDEVKKDEEKKDEAIKEDPPTIDPSRDVSPGVIAAASVGAVCISVLGAVWFILYLKSVVPNAVAPAVGLGPEVSYQPNSTGSPPSVSESGSMGQIQFSL